MFKIEHSVFATLFIAGLFEDRVVIIEQNMKNTLHSTQILREISKNPSISQREIAVKNRISLGKVNYAIKSLIEKGYVKIHNFSESKNKRHYIYVLTPVGMYQKAKLTTVFLKWKMEEYERIKKEIEELEKDVNGGS